MPVLPSWPIASALLMLVMAARRVAVARYLAAPVWLGFIFLLDPINARLGEESLSGCTTAVGATTADQPDAERTALRRALGVLELLVAARNGTTRCPIMEHVKIFEMPLPGYLGFPAFALECFTMYVFVRALCRLAPSFSAWVLTPRQRGTTPTSGRARVVISQP